MMVTRNKSLICVSCGKELKKSDKFCPNCGRKIDAQANASENQSVVKKDTTAKDKNKSQIKSIQTKHVVIVTAILVLFGFVNLLLSGVFDNPVTPELSGAEVSDPHKGIDMSKLAEIKQVEQIIEANPNDTKSLLHLLHLLKEAGLTEKAILSYEKYIKLQPDDYATLLEFAHFLHDDSRWSRAVEIYDIYLKNVPSDVDARVDQGVCYFSMKDFTNAIRVMEKALEYDNKHLFAHFNLGVVNLNAGNVEKGKELMRKVTELDPDSEMAKQAQEIINKN